MTYVSYCYRLIKFNLIVCYAYHVYFPIVYRLNYTVMRKAYREGHHIMCCVCYTIRYIIKNINIMPSDCPRQICFRVPVKFVLAIKSETKTQEIAEEIIKEV